VLAFVWAVGVADTRRSRERRDGRRLVPTILAGIGLLLASFVEDMPALVWTVGMTDACGGRETRDGHRFVSAVLTVECLWLLRLRKRKERQPCNQCRNNRFSRHMNFHLSTLHPK